MTETNFEVQIAKLTRYLDNFQSMLVLTKLFAAILSRCTGEFDPEDRICIELACKDLDPSIYLHVRNFKDFNIELLLTQTEKLNSSKKFKIDESFRLRITRVKYLPGGNKKRQHVHASVDRKRMSHSLVSIHVGQNLCLPAALFLNKFRLTHQIREGEADYAMWKNLRREYRKEQLEREVIWDMEAQDIEPGKVFGLEEIDRIQHVMYPEYQIVVLSAGHCNAVISHSPPSENTWHAGNCSVLRQRPFSFNYKPRLFSDDRVLLPAL